MTDLERQIYANIKPIDKSLQEKYLRGDLTLRQVREKLHHCGWFNYVPSEEQALKFIHLK